MHLNIKSILYHERECNGCRFDLFDDPHQNEAAELYKGERVNSQRFNVAQVNIIRLIFHRHQQD